ncbi:hypothetical protein M3Y95_00570700 [Aphelenchoides besseyi]|nr:hypothetical protein M3Y95_00570700 [Aphelenchoides besseyi]
MESEDEWWFERCAVYPPEGTRLFLVGFLGTFTAVVSLVFNGFLFLIFISKRHHRRSHVAYLTFLALIDTFLSASYILLFPTTIFMDYFESEILAQAWWSYVKPMLSISHVAITSSALLLCAATFERFVTISKIRSQFSMRYRFGLMAIVLIFALACKAPMFAEYEVVKNDNCTGVTEYTVVPTEWSEKEPYNFVYKFCFRTIATTFLPFFLSLHFNIRIVGQLRNQYVGLRLFRFENSEHRKNIRAATQMLVVISSIYLICNLPSVIIGVLEFIDKDMLITVEWRGLYTYSTDLISLLTLVACGSRLPIYYKCNRRIRREINSVILKLCYCGNPMRRQMSRDNVGTVRYLNTGNGYILYSTGQNHVNEKQQQHMTFGTGFDKVVLQVAIGEWNRSAQRMQRPTDSRTTNH